MLALMGLSGAILVHKNAWVRLPHVADARVTDAAALAEATQRMMTGPGQPRSIIYASDSFGLDQLTLAHGAGAYADHFKLSPEQRQALVTLDMKGIVGMGAHPLVPFLANMQVQRLRAGR